MTRSGNVVSALEEQRGAPGPPLIPPRKRSRGEEMVVSYPIEVRTKLGKLHCGTYHTLQQAEIARDCVTCITADYVPEKYGYRVQEIPSICKSLPNWEPLCRDLRDLRDLLDLRDLPDFNPEKSSKLRKSVSLDIRKLVDVVIRTVFHDQIPSSRGANGIRQPASDVETPVPLQSLKQVTGTPGTTRGHRETPVAGHSQQHASQDVEVDDVLSVREHQSNENLSGPLKSLPQAIAEIVRGFTCDQHEVFLRKLPDAVKRTISTLLAYDPSDAAASQFHINENSSDEKTPQSARISSNAAGFPQHTDNVITAGGRSQSPEIYGRTASTITSSKGRGKVVQELENLNEGAATDREEWVTSAELRTEPIRYQGRNLVLYDDLDCPVDAWEPSFHNVNPAVNYCSYSPTSSNTVPTSSTRCLSVEEEDINRELSQRQKPPAGDTDMEIVRERTEEALQQEGSYYRDELWTF